MPIDDPFRFEDIHLEHDLYGNEFAHQLATLTLRWGQLEYWFYLILRAIDPKQSPRWIQTFFRTRQLQRRIHAVKTQIEAEISQSHPKLLAEFMDCLALYLDIRKRRNDVAHGLWVSGTPRTEFQVQPLNLADGGTGLSPTFTVGFKWIGGLNEDIEKLRQRLGWIGAELAAHGYMKKVDNRRAALGLPPWK